MSAERLLDLAEEYRAAKQSRNDMKDFPSGVPIGREPALIADEYATELRRLLA